MARERQQVHPQINNNNNIENNSPWCVSRARRLGRGILIYKLE